MIPTQEDIIRMAREAGAIPMRDNDSMGVGFEFEIDALERFADMVEASEREACAKAVETNEDEFATLVSVAAVIRARSQPEQPKDMP